ncbi:TatD family hydrolase [Candidatus Bipolaricaulota bacterium]|nr:TatD family hydrolase [Candidatus Bipolaricaulota bacterium]MBS3825217.1 TatD family hydrolase [Candidatus Bipolaricaulota bacterium]
MKQVKPKLIDTHAHLDMGHYDDDREEVIERARKKSTGFINMGLDLSSSKKSIELAKSYDNVYAGIGFHPHEASKFNSSTLDKFRELSKHKVVKAIGEIGLDYYRDNSPRRKQREAFVAQLELACELELPVSVHNRDSTEDLLRILKSQTEVPAGVVHSFFGDYDLGEEFIDLGLYLGLSGPVTFDGNKRLGETVKELPLERLVLETDSPFLTPAPNRGKRNEPGYVEFVAKELAYLKDISFEVVSETTTRNARRLFDLNEC